MCRLNRRIWDYWLAGVLGSFAVLEYQALKRGCHPTLSRRARAALTLLLGRNGACVPFLAGAWFTWHLSRLSDDLIEPSDSGLDLGKHGSISVSERVL